MLDNSYLATLEIHRVIFHDLPPKRRGVESKPVLSEVDSPIDAAVVDHLLRSLTRALRSHAAYDIRFSATTQSVVPGLLRNYIGTRQASEVFVLLSQQLAQCVHTLQTGVISPGLLAVLEGVANGVHSVVILKLEREVGANLSLGERDGKRTFEMSVLRDLILTEGTKLFKTAFFARRGPGPNDLVAAACDSQLSYATSRDVAQFWLTFLGCEFIQDPSITTQQFYETIKKYVNDRVADPIVKADFYDALFAELKSQRPNIAPLLFITDHVPEEHRPPLRQYLLEHSVSLDQFAKDTSEIAGALRRKAYHTTQGAVLSVPAEKENLVAINTDSIVIADRLSRIDK